jgi:hypothetical protein
MATSSSAALIQAISAATATATTIARNRSPA